MYKVKSLTVSGIGKKIHRNGDVVSDTDFPNGRAKELVKGGFLVEIPMEKNNEPRVEKVAEVEATETEVKANILDSIPKSAPKKSGKK